MILQREITVSKDLITLFSSKAYERYAFEIVLLSKSVMRGPFEWIDQQSHGECDFFNSDTKEKYDFKLPFMPEQIELLTNGKKHEPLILEWLTQLRKEL